MVKWFLFQTWAGEALLSLLERCAGLAVVDAATLGNSRADLASPGCPATCAPGELCESHCREVLTGGRDERG